jgi:YD repeat-containing protein
VQADRSLSFLPLVVLISIFICALSFSVAPAQTGPVQYGYDELGRLIIVVDGQGNAAVYHYDAVGNWTCPGYVDTLVNCSRSPCCANCRSKARGLR